MFFALGYDEQQTRSSKIVKMSKKNALHWIKKLDLQKHPFMDSGYFKETFRDDNQVVISNQETRADLTKESGWRDSGQKIRLAVYYEEHHHYDTARRRRTRPPCATSAAGARRPARGGRPSKGESEGREVRASQRGGR